jgi:hypothetical protein
MSQATIRATVKARFDGDATLQAAGLLSVHSAKPRNWNPTEWRSDTLKTTAVGYVWIEENEELRAATGKKYIRYIVALVFLVRSNDTTAEEMADGIDTITDAIKARVRLDSHLGVADTVVFAAGQQLLMSGIDDLQHEAAESETWGVVRFDVSEWLTA